jgi:hypothetical protein
MTLPSGGARIERSFHRTNMKGDRMESTEIGPETGIAVAPRRPSRIKAGAAAVLIAGVLSTWGVASVFAADPSASPSASSGATASDDGSSTDKADCPAHADSSSSDSSTDTSS